jgi:hypothetical protein
MFRLSTNPKAEINNTNWGLDNSSYHNPIIVLFVIKKMKQWPVVEYIYVATTKAFPNQMLIVCS